MTNQFQLENILFFDIETVSLQRKWSDLSVGHQDEWRHKARFLLHKYEEEPTNEEIEDSFRDRAAIFSEFGKVICISAAFFRNGQLRVKSFAGNDEKGILLAFIDLFQKHFSDPSRHGLCGHNIKEFDVPYLCRRLLINEIPLPDILDITGKKPWETQHLLDTMEYWKFGDRKNFTSLHLLAISLKLPTPKDDISGKDVGRVFWEEDGIDRIVEYCQKDVVTVAQLFHRFSGKELVKEEDILVTEVSKFD